MDAFSSPARTIDPPEQQRIAQGTSVAVAVDDALSAAVEAFVNERPVDDDRALRSVARALRAKLAAARKKRRRNRPRRRPRRH